MQSIIHDTTIVTADEQCTVHYDAAIAIADDRIVAPGPNAELLARYPTAERIDGRGKAVMPGFANVHTHFGLTLARGIYEDLSPSHTPPFEGGLAPLPLPTLSHEERQVMCQLGMLEAIRSGTTLVLEDAVGILHYAEALEASGLRALLWERAWDRARAGMGQPGPFHADAGLAEQGLARIEALHTRWHGKGHGRIQIGLIALGTDNMAEDMVEVMRTALFMERVRRQDGRNPTPEQALLWATRHGYKALGVPDAGWLAPGNKADLIMVDLRKAHLVPLLRVVSCFVHQGQGRDVEAVMVDGRWLLRDGSVCTMDEETIVQEADRIGRAAWRRLFEERPDLQPPPGLNMAVSEE